MRYYLLKNFLIWDKWGYDIFRQEFVFFTLHDAFYNERHNFVDYGYKTKTWMKGSFLEFVKALTNKKLRKTFTLNTESFWTREKLTPND